MGLTGPERPGPGAPPASAPLASAPPAGAAPSDLPDPAFAALGSWAGVLDRVVSGAALSVAEAEVVMGEVLSGRAAPEQIAALVVGLRARGETVEEMTGFVRAMVAHAVPLSLPEGVDVVDTCGTGGDRLRSINVSTIAALVVAATGAKVAKHGGRASSSAVGAADVLEALGVVADLGPAGVRRCIDEVGMGFCFAPRFHPAMRYAAPVRKSLGIPTVFNYLGPLANPGRARFQVIGVSDPAMADKMIGVLAANGTERAMVVFGDDGLDELSTTGPSTVVEYRADRGGPAAGADGGGFPMDAVVRYRIDPRQLGLRTATIDELRGGDATVNADAIRRVIAGEPSPHRDIAVLNAAASLVVVGRADDLRAGMDLAAAVIDDGRAARVLDELVRVSTEEAAIEGRGEGS